MTSPKGKNRGSRQRKREEASHRGKVLTGLGAAALFVVGHMIDGGTDALLHKVLDHLFPDAAAQQEPKDKKNPAQSGPWTPVSSLGTDPPNAPMYDYTVMVKARGETKAVDLRLPAFHAASLVYGTEKPASAAVPDEQEVTIAYQPLPDSPFFTLQTSEKELRDRLPRYLDSRWVDRTFGITHIQIQPIEKKPKDAPPQES